MAAGKAAPKKAKRRLKSLVIDEISLVDNPAVPEAEFLIAKRDAVAEFGEVIEETASRIAKGESETYALQDVLRMTADVIGMIQGLSRIASSGDLDEKVVKAVLTMLKQYGVSIAVNNADGVPVDMMAGAVYQNAKSEGDVDEVAEIDAETIEKAQRVLSAQQYKQLAGACDVLKQIVDKARKIGKSAEEGASDDDEAMQVGEADVATQKNDDTVTEDAPASPTLKSEDETTDAAKSEEVVKAEGDDVAEEVEDVEKADPEDEDEGATVEFETLSDRINAVWAKRQEDKIVAKRSEEEQRLMKVAESLGNALSKFDDRLSRIDERVTRATGGGVE